VTTVREAERHLDRLDADQSVAGDAAVRTYELRGLTPTRPSARSERRPPSPASARRSPSPVPTPPRPRFPPHRRRGPHKWRIRTARRNSSRAVCGSIGRFGAFQTRSTPRWNRSTTAPSKRKFMPSCRQPVHWTPEGHAGRGTLCYSGPYHIRPRQRRRRPPLRSGGSNRCKIAAPTAGTHE